MFRKVVIVFVISLLCLAVPLSVFAAEPAEIKVFVRNQTGGPVELALTDADGLKTFYSLPAGITELELLDGWYDYYASTQCGAQSGVWNLPTTRSLYIGCKDGMVSTAVVVNGCQKTGLYIYHDFMNPIFIPWTNYGERWAEKAPWDNEHQFVDFYLNQWYLYDGWHWGCFDSETDIEFGGPDIE